jgi:hypothetical protein
MQADSNQRRRLSWLVGLAVATAAGAVLLLWMPHALRRLPPLSVFRLLIGMIAVLSLSSFAIACCLLSKARAAWGTAQWPPEGTATLRGAGVVTGRRARAIATWLAAMGAALILAAGCLAYLAFRFARLFRI